MIGARDRLGILSALMNEIRDVRDCHFASNCNGDGVIVGDGALEEQRRLNKLVVSGEKLTGYMMEADQ